MTATQVSPIATQTAASIRELVQNAYNQGASGLYLQIGRAPFYRLHGKLVPQDQFAVITPDRYSHYIQEILSPTQLKQYLETQKLDASVQVSGFMQARLICGPTTQGVQAMSLSAIEFDQPSIDLEESGTIRRMVKDALAQGASDIHLQVGEMPRYRIQGQMCLQEQYGTITIRQFEDFLAEILSPEQREIFHSKQELDTAIFYPNLVRCRVNCAQSLMGGVIVLRLISLEVPTIAKLRLPDRLAQLVEERQGLILVTGPVNSGKSTSLAAMLRHINETLPRKIVTIEDPIEYVHTSNQCLITQREVGLHTQEFKEALRAALRQDPDILLIGEMRDRETVDTAIRASLTGHLVLGTLHTKGAVNAVKRLLNFYTPEEQELVRLQIVEALRAVIGQTLVPTIQGGRSAALEIMLNTDTIRDYLQKGCIDEIYQLMEEGTDGSQTLNQALFDLYKNGEITDENALSASLNPDDLNYMLKNESRRSSRSGLMSKAYYNPSPI
ncbi:MAG: PilT/PilU family type 4a pilus ATPase [Leptolyngbya sp. Prado105]|nr:PilT/PilU family type 4a pilus ATPase [Leptolyngbya sp. Prado105]